MVAFPVINLLCRHGRVYELAAPALHALVLRIDEPIVPLVTIRRGFYGLRISVFRVFVFVACHLHFSLRISTAKPAICHGIAIQCNSRQPDEDEVAMEKTETAPARSWLSYTEVERYTGYDRTTIWRAVKRGDLRAGGLEGTPRFSKDDIDSWLRRRGRVGE